jgi:hypothetical protein
MNPEPTYKPDRTPAVPAISCGRAYLHVQGAVRSPVEPNHCHRRPVVVRRESGRGSDGWIICRLWSERHRLGSCRGDSLFRNSLLFLFVQMPLLHMGRVIVGPGVNRRRVFGRQDRPLP